MYLATFVNLTEHLEISEFSLLYVVLHMSTKAPNAGHAVIYSHI